MINYRTLQHESSQSQTLCATTKPGHTLLIALPLIAEYTKVTASHQDYHTSVAMRKTVGGLVLICVIVLAWYGAIIFKEISKASNDDPAVWEQDIQAFVAHTKSGSLPEKPIVFVGSSSFRLWKSMAEDLAPLPVVNRGFGGSRLADIEHWAEELVNINSPAAVVVFCGTNDIRPDYAAEPEVLLKTYQSFVERIRVSTPDLPVYFVGITPSPRRWSVWNVAQQTNELIREWSASQLHLYFIDTAADLLGDDGVPNPENYIIDGLHLSDKGYEIWTDIIKPRLIADFPASGKQT